MTPPLSTHAILSPTLTPSPTITTALPSGPVPAVQFPFPPLAVQVISAAPATVATRQSTARTLPIPTATLLEHALLAQGFMGVQKATFPCCLRPQNRDFTCANLVEALK